jgi:hypothetical protein
MAHLVVRDVQSPTAAAAATWAHLCPPPHGPHLVITRGDLVDVYEVDGGRGGDGKLQWVTTLACEGIPASIVEVPLPAVALKGCGVQHGVAVGFATGRLRVYVLDASSQRLVQVAVFNFEWDAVGAGAFLRVAPAALRPSGAG